VADGAEAVSVLMASGAGPGDDLAVEGFDIDPAHLEAAASLRFLPEQLPDEADGEVVARYLERDRDGWRLRDPFRPMVHIGRGDLRDAGSRAPVDLVMCQNTLVSFAADDARAAVAGLGAEVRTGGWLAVGGGALDVVPAAVVALGFEPVLDDVEAIHEAWAVQRAFWANAHRPYWALEPFTADHPDGPARYGTVFRRGPDA
jgi:hypothetical protein